MRAYEVEAHAVAAMVVGPALARELLVLPDDQHVELDALGQLASLGDEACVLPRIGKRDDIVGPAPAAGGQATALCERDFGLVAERGAQGVENAHRLVGLAGVAAEVAGVGGRADDRDGLVLGLVERQEPARLGIKDEHQPVQELERPSLALLKIRLAVAFGLFEDKGASH